MISNKNIANIFLIFTIISAIAFYSYYIAINKGSIKVENSKKIIQDKNSDLKIGTTVFTNVEYKSSDEKNRNYITKGKEAFISKESPNLIQLNFVHSYTKLKDGTILNVNSNKAVYFKDSQNIKYYEGVTIVNKDKRITAKTANFQKNKNKIRLEKNVIFKSPENIIKGDIAELDTITNDLKIFMNKKKDKVYGRREQSK